MNALFQSLFQSLPVSLCLMWCFFDTCTCVLRREFYEHLRDWIVETELDRYRSGRVFEYMWAIMFGAPPVSHPLEECDLLTCTDEVRA